VLPYGIPYGYLKERKDYEQNLLFMYMNDYHGFVIQTGLTYKIEGSILEAVVETGWRTSLRVSSPSCP